MNGKRKQTPFEVPMVWRELVGHHSDYYFCMTKLSEFSGINKSKVVYPDYKSALKPVSHDLGISVPILSAKSNIENKEIYKSCINSAESSTDEMCVAYVDEKKPHLLSQLELNDQVQHLSLSKAKAKLLSSRQPLESASRGF